MEGQQWRSLIGDIAFLSVVCVLGLKHVLSEGVLATLLAAYAAGRFGVAHGKQQAAIALTSGPSGTGSSGPGASPTPNGEAGGSGTSVPPISRAHRQTLGALIGVKV